MKRKSGVSLVELLIAISVGSMLLVIAFKLMSSWMRSSVKGASHLSNMQTAVLLSNQIEYDLQRAVKVEADEKGCIIKTILDVGGDRSEEIVSYEENAKGEGIRRVVVNEGKIVRDRVIGHDFKVNRIEGEPIIKKIALAGDRYCVKIQFAIASPKNEDAYSIEKLIFCSNSSENAFIQGWSD